MAKERLLIVEDELLIAMDIKQSLEDMGYDVLELVDNGRKAIDVARLHKPDLVLMDIKLQGDMNGTEAGRQIARLGIPVIYLTAYSDPETVRQATETMPYGFLTKPFQKRELSANIEVALHKAAMERRLWASEQWLAATLRCVGDAVIATDEIARVTFLNPAAETLTGWHADAAAGRPVDDVMRLVNIKGQHLVLPLLGLLQEENQIVDMEKGIQLQTRDGRHIPVSHSIAAIQTRDGRTLGSVIVLRDVSEIVRFTQRLRSSEEHFRHIFESSAVGMALVSVEGIVLSVNQSFARMLGHSAAALKGKKQLDLDDGDNHAAESGFLCQLLDGSINTAEFDKAYRRHDSDTTLWATVNITLLQGDANNGTCFLYQVHDLTERRRAEIQMEHMALTDPLTDLGNRAWLDAELARLLTHAARYAESLAVAFIDLDHFKQVNDSLGHEAGDEVLKVVAKRLRSGVRESDCVVRMGGDEFVLILEKMDSRAKVAQTLDKLRDSVALPIPFAGQQIVVTASMGVSLYPNDGNDARLLLRYADHALLNSKAGGRNCLTIYHDSQNVLTR